MAKLKNIFFMFFVLLVLMITVCFFVINGERDSNSMISNRNNGIKDEFLCPLGIIPLLNDDVKEIILQNGFEKNLPNLTTEKYLAAYYICLSAERIEHFIKQYSEKFLPDKAYAILEVLIYDGKTGADTKSEYLTPFCEKKFILDKIQKYFFRIINDCDVGFGMAFYNDRILDEIFLTNQKTIIIYSSNPIAFERLLSEERIFEFEDYNKRNFIGDYPNASMSLFALADLYPDRYSQYRNNDYFTLKYTQQLMNELNFKENK